MKKKKLKKEIRSLKCENVSLQVENNYLRNTIQTMKTFMKDEFGVSVYDENIGVSFSRKKDEK